MASTPTIFKRGKWWWIRYRENGEPVREPLDTTDKRIAERKRYDVESRLRDPNRQYSTNNNPTIESFWKKYSEWAEDHKKDVSVERCATSWDQLIELTDASRVGDITPDELERFKRHARDELKNRLQTVNNKLSDIRAIFNRGIKKKWIAGPNPVDQVEKYTITRTISTRAQYHSVDGLASLLAAARARDKWLLTDPHRILDYRLEWVVLLGGRAGLRRSEISEARWEWFDFNDERPTISLTEHEGFTLKDREERVVPMDKKIRDAMYPHRRKTGFVFSSNRQGAGRSKYRFNPRKSLVRYLVETELNKTRPFHRLRYSFGSLHLQAGTRIEWVSEWMGHSNVIVTQRHYVGILGYNPAIDAF